jgi:mono/diheme cytochrome c family protein
MIEQPKGDARQRENPDPTEKDVPVPRTVLAIISLLLLWAVGYILTTQRNDDPTLGDQRTMSTLEGKPAGAAGAADGGQLFGANCVACHQATGAGLPGVFPPLAGAEWVNGSDKLAANILLHGVTGKLSVKGAEYNGSMPAFKDKMSDAEIAAVLSYVRANFGNAAGKVTSDVVKSEREAGKDRSTPWNGDEDLAKLK